MNTYSFGFHPDARAALDRGAALVVSISGGKDSQAMLQVLTRFMALHYPNNRFCAVHADLGRAEWPQTPAFVERMVRRAAYGVTPYIEPVELHVVRREQGDLVDRIEQRMRDLEGTDRPFWPSSAARYCTSDLKRNPIDKFLRTFDGEVICAIGLRADESPARAKKQEWSPRKQITTTTRTAYNWHPILDWTEDQVWDEIIYGREHLEKLRQQYRDGTIDDYYLEPSRSPIHPAYIYGNERLSCALCILGSKNDLRNGVKHHPELAAHYSRLEQESGFTFKQGFSLTEFILTPEEHADEDEQLSLFPPCSL